MNLDQIFRQAIELKASDIHFASGEIPRYRIDGSLVPVDMPAIPRDQLSELLEPVFSPEAQAQIGAGLRVEKSTLVAGVAFSGVGFRAGENGLVVTFRLLNNEIPSLEKIGFDALGLLEEITKMPSGLVVISGPTGSGKWTTACSMIEHINLNSTSRIFVVSSQAGFVLSSKQSLITDLRVGLDCQSHVQAMEAAHHADLDVIALDDLPTEEVVREALLLAGTGHLVVANLHAVDSRDALRILMHRGGEDREEYFHALAANLVVVTGQRLLPKRVPPGRAAAYDWLRIDGKLRGLIESGDPAGLKGFSPEPEVGRTRREAIQLLLQQGLIDEETASRYLSADGHVSLFRNSGRPVLGQPNQKTTPPPTQ